MKLNTKYVQEDDATLYRARYGDGSTAIIIRRTEDGEPLLKATVSLASEGELPAPGNVFIKDWSENEGVFVALHEAGVVGTPVRTVRVGRVVAIECPLLAEIEELA